MIKSKTDTPSALNDDELGLVVGGADPDDEVWDIVDADVNVASRARGGAVDVLRGGAGNDTLLAG